MSKSLKNIQGSKQRSSSTNYISLHFNKADEEQLEISYVDEVDIDEKSHELEEVSKEELNQEKSLHSDGLKDIDENASCATASDEIEESSSKHKPSSKDSNRDSVVKDYWSRLSKRASSLDSDLAILDKNSDQNEGWLFFKDIKGKLTKTLEERKQKDGSKGASKIVVSESLGNFSKEDYDRISAEEDKTTDKSLQLSPAIEVFDADKLDSQFESYVDGELQKAKCEIISPHIDKIPSTFEKTDKSDENTSQTSSSASNIPNLTVQKPLVDKNNDHVLHESDKVNNSAKRNCLHETANYIRNLYCSLKSYWNSLSFRLMIAVLALCLVPVPSWFSGFVAGAFLSGYIVYYLLKNSKPKEKLFIPEFNTTPNVEVTEAQENIIYKGWMNELPSDIAYNPETYHVNCTRSIYVRLDGSYLRVSYPQTNIPRRAMYNEPRFERQFIHQQHYDITSATIELLPTGLARKRLWSKKYPICLTVPSPLPSNTKEATNLNTTPKTSSRKDSPVKRLVPRINENKEIVLILFSRTDREKDLWYYRFKKAAKLKLLKSHSPLSSPDLSRSEVHSLENKRTMSAELDTLQIDSPDSEDFVDLSMSKQQKFELYMSRLMAPLRADPFLASSKDKKNGNAKATSSSLNSMSWLNALIGRLFFDFITEDVWAQCVAEKIRKKLSKLKLPVFLTELSIKDINLGTALPKIHRASEPTVDQRGIWIDIDVSYNGSFQMTLETKLNLLRYRCDPDDLSLSDLTKGSESINQVLRSPVYNSEEEDSAESSSDEDFPAPEPLVAEESSSQAAGGSAGKKLLRLVDRFAQSTYFQHATKNKYIKKAMEDISNTPLVLTVEVQWLAGTLALNIPPMPTDRLWYGFRTNPYLSIVARPKLGHHAVTLTHITEWIERKLVLEFQKLLVMPNMDDLIIPIMQPDLDLP